MILGVTRTCWITSILHGFDTFLHKTRNCGLLLSTQCGQMATEHIVYRQEEHDDYHH